MTIQMTVLLVAIASMPSLLGQQANQTSGKKPPTNSLLRAADAGDAAAQFELGRKYAQGQGRIQDYVQAYKWLNLAAAGGYRPAAALRDSLVLKMSKDQIGEGQRLAREWRPESPPPARDVTPTDEFTVHATQSDHNLSRVMAKDLAFGGFKAKLSNQCTNIKYDDGTSKFYLAKIIITDTDLRPPQQIIPGVVDDNYWYDIVGDGVCRFLGRNSLDFLSDPEIVDRSASGDGTSAMEPADRSGSVAGSEEQAAIDRLRRGPHSTIPPAETSRGAAGTSATLLTINNGTNYGLRVYLTGPERKTIQVPPSSARTVEISPGQYEVGGELAGAGVVPFYGVQNFAPGTVYQQRFYIK